MKKKLIVVVIIVFLWSVLLATVGVMASPTIENPAYKAPQYAQTLDEELMEVQELMLITSDLMMALDVKQRLLSGQENVISFSDGTEIKIDVPSSVISQLDAQIEKLKSLLIQKIDEKKVKWDKK